MSPIVAAPSFWTQNETLKEQTHLAAWNRAIVVGSQTRVLLIDACYCLSQRYGGFLLLHQKLTDAKPDGKLVTSKNL